MMCHTQQLPFPGKGIQKESKNARDLQLYSLRVNVIDFITNPEHGKLGLNFTRTKGFASSDKSKSAILGLPWTGDLCHGISSFR